ncbi:MAG: TMEM165/GDT1 family protein [Thermodesulfobacteria bacterium]|nr:TMEM165/GDT1 family protein [Thermodesulfobacteriota bacterium]
MFDFKIFITVFGSVFLSELGDKTQLATFLFATTEKGRALSVFAGSACALVLSSALAVLGAGVVGKYMNPALINKIAGIGFIVIGVWILINRG